MSLRAALPLLDVEIESLQPKVRAATERGQLAVPEFFLVRAKSLARSLLRRAQQLSIEDPAAFDLYYRNTRKRFMLEDE